MDEQSNEWTIKWMNHWISRTADGQTDCHTNNEKIIWKTCMGTFLTCCFILIVFQVRGSLLFLLGILCLLLFDNDSPSLSHRIFLCRKLYFWIMMFIFNVDSWSLTLQVNILMGWHELVLKRQVIPITYMAMLPKKLPEEVF